jgi:hypothetical protein
MTTEERLLELRIKELESNVIGLWISIYVIMFGFGGLFLHIGKILEGMLP